MNKAAECYKHLYKKRLRSLAEPAALQAVQSVAFLAQTPPARSKSYASCGGARSARGARPAKRDYSAAAAAAELAYDG